MKSVYLKEKSRQQNMSRVLLYPVYTIGWTNRLFVQFRSTRLSNWLYNAVWQPAVYTMQPVVKPVVKRVWQPV